MARARSWVSMVTGRTSQTARTVSRISRTSDTGIFSLRIATAANSFRTWTLIVPCSASSVSTRSAFCVSFDSRYSRTLVSKNASAALIGLESVELERGGEAAAELAQPREELPGTGRPGHLESLLAHDLDLELVAFSQAKGFDHRGGKANCEA